ncbi:hypothetical protein D3C81_1991110 [compost metagenome]
MRQPVVEGEVSGEHAGQLRQFAAPGLLCRLGLLYRLLVVAYLNQRRHEAMARRVALAHSQRAEGFEVFR